MAARKKKESAHYTLLPFMGGVEMLRATFSTHSFSRHFHRRYAVGCIEGGAMRFHYLGASHVAAQGQVNLVVPGEAHDGHAADGSGWAYRMFYLEPEALTEAARAVSLNHGPPHFDRGVIMDPALAWCLARTHRILESPHAGALEKETRLMWLLAHWIERHASGAGNPPRHATHRKGVAEAREYMIEHLDRDLSLDELAGVANLSRFHFLRVFEDQTGVTPHNYLTQVRLDRARSLLSGTMRMADIAQETGFSDQPHLTRLFKRRYGITPGRYRNILQNK